MVSGLARPRLWAIFFLISVLLSLAGLAVAGRAAAQSTGNNCPVTATAQGAEIAFSANDNVLTQAPAGAGVPAVQACVNFGLGSSSAYASNPYPGETVLSITQGAPSAAPAYPFYVSSSYPSTPHAGSAQPGYSLDAASTKTSSTSAAKTGGAQGGGSAGAVVASTTATVDPATGASQATAQADTQPLTINGVLVLGQVHSMASDAAGPGGRHVSQSVLQIGRTTVAGQVVQITPQGIQAAGHTVPLPGAGLAGALRQAGVSVRYLSAVKTSQGVESAGLEVTAVQKNPDTGGIYTVDYVFGRSFAAAAPVPANGSTGVSSQPGAAAPSPGGALRSPGGARGSPGALGPTGGAAGRMQLPLVTGGPGSLRSARVQDMGIPGVYLVTVLCVLAMFGCGTLLRLLGVRNRWIL